MTDLSNPVAFVEGLFVDESSRKKGIGRALIEELEKTATRRGHSTIYSDTEAFNTASIAFHLRCGFHIFRATATEVVFEKRIV